MYTNFSQYKSYSERGYPNLRSGQRLSLGYSTECQKPPVLLGDRHGLTQTNVKRYAYTQAIDSKLYRELVTPI